MSLLKKPVLFDWDNKPWIAVKVSELFESCETGKIKKISDLKEGTVPVISSSIERNGVVGFYDAPAIYENIITVSKVGGHVFYHNYKCNVTVSAIVLKPSQELREHELFYLSAVMNKIFQSRYDFMDKATPSKIMNETIRIPGVKQ